MPAERDLARRLTELEWLHASLRAITATLDLGQLVRAVLDAIRTVVSAEALSLMLYDRERDELVFAASETLCEDTLLGPAPAGVAREPGLEAHRLVVPLVREGQRLGMLELHERWDGRPFDAQDRDRARAVAAELAAELDPTTIAHDAQGLRAVFARVGEVIPTHASTLVLRDDRGREVGFGSSRALRPGVVDGVRLRADSGIAGWVARRRETVCIEDARVDPRHDPSLARQTGLIARSMICVPLLHRGTLYGVVQVINKQGAARFSPDDVRLVEALTGQAAIAIANAQLYRAAELASLTDDLTGLGNTRRFNAVLPVALARGGPVSLLVLDLDGLKGIVDRHGHLVGARSIATTGRLIAEQVRPGDTAARFGGDEFVVILPDADAAEAVAIGRRIGRAIAACTHPDGMDVDISELTGSIGVATFPADAPDAEGLFRAADRAMYGIKSRGKNGVAAA